MEPDDLMRGPAVQAAVAALADRNRHHLEQMTPEEREDAVEHWRDLAVTVLAAATSATAEDDDDEEHGRATIVLEDAGGEDVTVHATFWPEVRDLGNGEVAATPAQVAAIDLLNRLAPDSEEDEPVGP
jgi:hypothetical protein